MGSSTRQRPAFHQVEAETLLIYELVCSHGLEFAAAFRMDFDQVIARVMDDLDDLAPQLLSCSDDPPVCDRT
jgi:hypothetical protein